MYTISKESLDKSKDYVARSLNRQLLTNIHKFNPYSGFSSVKEAKLIETLVEGLAIGESVKENTGRKMTSAFPNLYGTYAISTVISKRLINEGYEENVSNNFTNIETKQIKTTPNISPYIQERFNEYLEKFMSMNQGALNFDTANKFTGMYFRSLRTRLEIELKNYEELQKLGTLIVGDLTLNGLQPVEEQEIPSLNFSDLIGNEDVKKQLSLDATRLVCYNFKIRNGVPSKVSNSVILYGEPGTGKTSLVYAAANYVINAERFRHNNNPFRFMKIRVTDIFDKFLGQSAKNIESILNQVSDPEHITMALIDDGDSYFSNRENNGGKEVDAHTLNVLFEFLDRKAGNYILFITTNFYEQFDPAIKSKIGLKLEVKKPETLDEYAGILKGKINSVLPEDFNRLRIGLDDYQLLASKARSLKLSPRDIEKIAEHISQKVTSIEETTLHDYCTFNDEETVMNPSKNYRDLTKDVVSQAIESHVQVQRKAEAESIKRAVETKKKNLEVQRQVLQEVTA